MESPQRAVQRGPLEQDGGTKLCVQDGAADGGTDSVSVDTSQSPLCVENFNIDVTDFYPTHELF